MCEECKRRARGEHAALELRSYPFARYTRRPLNALAVKRQVERAANVAGQQNATLTQRARDARATHTPEDRARLMWGSNQAQKKKSEIKYAAATIVLRRKTLRLCYDHRSRSNSRSRNKSPMLQLAAVLSQLVQCLTEY
ncbi:hypothetical protein B5X24_HaOG215656 [Helicoverpa armigera]|nr:hypothetical protein B5X24_HaOG215656 [Helicoverpa armigera]